MQEHWTFSKNRPPFIRSLFTIVLYCSCWSYFTELLKHLKPKIRYCLVVNISDHSSKKQTEECVIKSRCTESSHWRAEQTIYETPYFCFQWEYNHDSFFFKWILFLHILNSPACLPVESLKLIVFRNYHWGILLQQLLGECNQHRGGIGWLCRVPAPLMNFSLWSKKWHALSGPCCSSVWDAVVYLIAVCVRLRFAVRCILPWGTPKRIVIKLYVELKIIRGAELGFT